MLSRLAAGLLALLIAAACPARADQKTVSDAVDAAVAAWMKDQKVASAEIAVSFHGAMVNSYGHGGWKPQDPHLLASLSKAITAVCVAEFIDQNKLSFKDTIGTVLAKDFEKYGEPTDKLFKGITVEQLLTHRAGLEKNTFGNATTVADAFKQTIQTPLRSAPGSKFFYSDSGYLLLGLMAERLSGAAYAKTCLKPLTETGATGTIEPSLVERAPNGGWKVSAVDYLKFLHFFDSGSNLLKPATKSWLRAPFADGIVEDITTALSRFSSLFVIARNSAFTYKGRPVDVKQVGIEMGVRYVLEGSVRKAQNRVRISGQLIEAENGTHIWADRYEGDLGDVFALQDQITTSVVGALLPKLETAEIERARKKPTDSLDAYDLYLRALAAFYSWTREGNGQVITLLERSLQLDPRFVAAAVIADNCWAARYAQGWSPIDEAIAQSMRYITLAVALDPDSAEALAVLARRTPSIKHDREETIVLAERAVASNPNSAFAWRCTGYALMFIGEAERAVEHFQRTLRLSPRDPRAYDAITGLAYAMVQLDRDTEAIGLFRDAIRQNVEFAPAWRGLTSALAMIGQREEAQRALSRTMELDPNFSLQSINKRLGFSDSVRAGRLFDGWRRAGVRE